jgi:hypothetical protein
VPSAARTSTETECRQCCSFCDRLVEPAGCLEAGCRYLYLYDDERTGARFMGCLNKVFKVEIDTELFRQAQRTRHGYGGVKMTGKPLPQCRVSVERAYHGVGQAFECVNPGFFDRPPNGSAVKEEPAHRSGWGEPGFDLRDGL